MSAEPSFAGPSVLEVQLGTAVPEADGWVTRDFRAPAGLDGPPGILQGGLSAGLVMTAARLLHPSAPPVHGFEVRLHAPTPLARDLQVRARPTPDGYEVETRDGDRLLVAGVVVLDDREADPDPADVLGLARVPVPVPEPQPEFVGCWVCGAHPGHPYGQRLVPGWHDKRSVVSAWRPDAVLGDGSGLVHELIVSAVLDCPTVWASWSHVRGRGDVGALLAGYRLRLIRPAPLGRLLRTVGRCDDVDGRKIHARGALLDDAGTLYALSSALHISVDRLPEL